MATKRALALDALARIAADESETPERRAAAKAAVERAMPHEVGDGAYGGFLSPPMPHHAPSGDWVLAADAVYEGWDRG